MDDALWTSIRRAVESVENREAARVDVPERDGKTATVYAVGGTQLIRIDIKEAK